MGIPVRAILRRTDGFQQRHRFAAFPVAVWKKFSDDQAGNLAALLAYYAFVSIFPLLLVLVTVLGIVLNGNPDLQKRVLDSALSGFPVIGQQLRTNIHSLTGNGWALAIGIIGTLLGSRAIAGALQNALNEVWEVPMRDRSGFPNSWLRSFALIGLLFVGVLVTTVLSGFGAWGGQGVLGAGARVGALLLSLAVNIGLFWLAFRLATAKVVATRDLRDGAILAAVVWQVLQALGGFIVGHYLRRSSSVYGTFGIVLGLLAWLYLQAQLTLYAAEADVVRARGLWPRSLFPPPLTEQDQRAYKAYAKVEERRKEEEVDVHLGDGEPGGADGEAPRPPVQARDEDE